MIFITLEDALEFHHQMIFQFGGSHGIRDLGLLMSAIEIPQATFGGEYLHPTLFDQAAAYLFHIIGNHPFVDGNKRSALVIALTFLSIHGVELPHNFLLLEDLVVEIAEGKHIKEKIASFLKKHAIHS